jgi:signal peptidase I
MDFPLLLVIATFVTGILWALDVLWWAPARRERAESLVEQAADEATVEKTRRQPTIVEYARAFFPVILVVLMLRSFVVEPFRIPSGSMMPTLLTGDFILVNKFSYGLRLPVVHTRILDLGEPERGDVAVFRYPEDPSIDYIKRIIGLPGDFIEFRDKAFYINGEAVVRESEGRYQGEGTAVAMTGARLYRERLGDTEYRVLLESGGFDHDFNYRVPEGHYFAVGDNRDNSRDSRFWGPVPEDHLVGRAFLIWMNWDSVDTTIRWERLGSLVE